MEKAKQDMLNLSSVCHGKRYTRYMHYLRSNKNYSKVQNLKRQVPDIIPAYTM